jgi:tetratricopeptide (TPR) repeat protein
VAEKIPETVFLPSGPVPGGLAEAPGGEPAGPWVDAEKDEHAEIKKYFARFGEAVLDPASDLSDVFWYHDLMPSTPSGSGLDESFAPAERFGRTVVRRERAIWRGWDWTKTDVRKVTKLSDSDRYEAIVWHTAKDGPRVKRRWHLMDTGNQTFVALGWEDLVTGISAWDLATAEAQATGLSRQAREQGRFRELLQVYRHLDADRFEDARKVLDRLQRVRFESTLQYAVDLAEVRYAVRVLGSHQLDLCEELVSRDPSRLAAHLLLAEMCLMAEEYERVKEVCDSYRTVVGDDPDALALKAEAHYRLIETDEATALFEQARKLDPFQPMVLNWVRRDLPSMRKYEIADRLAQAPQPDRLFGVLARGAKADEDWLALEVLGQKFRAMKPTDPRGPAQLIQARCAQKKPEEAVAAYRESILNLVGMDRMKLTDSLFDGLMFTNELSRMYEAVPDDLAGAVFRRLSGAFWARVDVPKQEADAKLIAKLMEQHRKRFPDDIWLSYCEGRLAMQKDDTITAAKQFAAALAKIMYTGDLEADSKSGYSELQYQQTRVLYKLGRSDEALRNLKPTAAVFGQLAWIHTANQDAAGLSQLLNERKKVEPQASDLAYWQAELHWMKNEYPAAAEQYRAFLDREEFQLFSDREGARQRLVRSLIRCQKAKEAAVEFATWEYPLAVFSVLVLAAQGDVAAADRKARELLETSPYLDRIFYGDADLGPILKGEPFAQFRKDFPPPEK